jgi:hypothetical protein
MQAPADFARTGEMEKARADCWWGLLYSVDMRDLLELL